jgi:nicotinamide mononucleotide adenylyltransferase
MELQRLSMNRSRIPVGCVHGRFQPFHNEHLAYLLAAKERCDFLWIGITKYEAIWEEMSPLARHRERPENNPFTYFERLTMITESLSDLGEDRRTFGFIPFPIEMPQRLAAFLPRTVTCFTTICEEWNREKISVLKSEGYTVDVLWERGKSITAGEIRKEILQGRSIWRDKVPKATANMIDSLDVKARLEKLMRKGATPYDGSESQQ